MPRRHVIPQLPHLNPLYLHSSIFQRPQFSPSKFYHSFLQYHSLLFFSFSFLLALKPEYSIGLIPNYFFLSFISIDNLLYFHNCIRTNEVSFTFFYFCLFLFGGYTSSAGLTSGKLSANSRRCLGQNLGQSYQHLTWCNISRGSDFTNLTKLLINILINK